MVYSIVGCIMVDCVKRWCIMCVCVCVCVFVCVCTSELPSNWQERKRLREEEQLKLVHVAGPGKDGEPSSPKPYR
jgi:hypothetical protein